MADLSERFLPSTQTRVNVGLILRDHVGFRLPCENHSTRFVRLRPKGNRLVGENNYSLRKDFTGFANAALTD
jgi:hypothetical protein